MNNTLIVQSKKLTFFVIGILFSIIFFFCSAAMFFTGKTMKEENYNGLTLTINGKIESISDSEDDAIIALKLEGSNTQYNVITFTKELLEENGYTLEVGNTVTLYTPQDQVGENLWVLGIERDGETLVDKAEVVAMGEKENNTIIIVSAVFMCIFVATTIVLFYFKGKVDLTTEAPFDEKYAEFFRTLFPRKTSVKANAIVCGVFLILLIGLIVPIALFAETNENLATIFAIIWICCPVLFSLYTMVHSIVVPKIERRYYIKNFPFDLDAERLKLLKNKEQKAEIEKELELDRIIHPHCYTDAGNLYICKFDKEKVTFSYPNEEQNVSVDDVFDENVTPQETDIVTTLTYDELHLKAVPFYSRDYAPIIVIIESKIDSSVALPDSFVNDIYLILDKYLYETIKEFNVPIEGLDEIMSNLEKLVNTNCPKAKLMQTGKVLGLSNKKRK